MGTATLADPQMPGGLRPSRRSRDQDQPHRVRVEFFALGTTSSTGSGTTSDVLGYESPPGSPSSSGSRSCWCRSSSSSPGSSFPAAAALASGVEREALPSRMVPASRSRRARLAALRGRARRRRRSSLWAPWWARWPPGSAPTRRRRPCRAPARSRRSRRCSAGRSSPACSSSSPRPSSAYRAGSFSSSSPAWSPLAVGFLVFTGFGWEDSDAGPPSFRPTALRRRRLRRPRRRARRRRLAAFVAVGRPARAPRRRRWRTARRTALLLVGGELAVEGLPCS